MPFSKLVIALLCLKVKRDNISGSTTSSFTYDNFSFTAEHDLPNCLVYVPLDTTWPRYIATVSFWNLSTHSIFKHMQDLFQANCFTGVYLYSKLREQNKPLQRLALIQRSSQCSWVGDNRMLLVWQQGPKEMDAALWSSLTQLLGYEICWVHNFFIHWLFLNINLNKRNYLQTTQAANLICSTWSHKVLWENEV